MCSSDLSSTAPLRVYVHERGLIRFAQTKYDQDTGGIGMRSQFLTNTKVNAGAKGGNKIGILLKLKDKHLKKLRESLSELKQDEFEEGMSHLKRFHDPEVAQTYIVPKTLRVSSSTRAIFGTHAVSTLVGPANARVAISLEGDHDTFMADPENAAQAARDVGRAAKCWVDSTSGRAAGRSCRLTGMLPSSVAMEVS